MESASTISIEESGAAVARMKLEHSWDPETDDPSTIEKLAKNKQKPITPETAEKLARDLKAVKYVECSALTQKGLKNVFDEAILAALEPPEPKKSRRCVLL
ncbi:hypothetical protein QTO34_011142 [Cnephaeus nilssonii]|uniref:Uncharacterized protein n=1 Tax=Cnephaeus nilssonii TaxID=3371016 RepID=A0AA40HCY6_CNENI|nr:hypothetical protein QTO34_011142 [Eptesicus nilssonii]